MTNQEIWQAALGELELTISKVKFSTWFRDTTIISSESGKIIISVPHAFAKEWLESKMNKDIFRALQHVTSNGIREIHYQVGVHAPRPQERPEIHPQFSVQPSAHQQIQRSSLESSDRDKQYLATNLNPKYRFESFVVGSNNELARAACIAVANNLGRSYNPLFIYGGVGLGKTHLLQSVGNAILEKDPNKKVRYISSESFTNEVVEAIRKQTMTQFKDKYRQIDLLIIDDIQFLASKEKTQEEFFYTFNALYESNKQIIISSDRPPKAIPTLEERLRSRFEGGMIADIGAPDLETRVAILQKKLLEKKFTLAENVINYIATNIQNNVRELEGAINRIIAYCQINSSEPSLENAKHILASIITSPARKATTAQKIIETVAAFYAAEVADLTGKSRKKEIVRPRQIAMYLLREEIKSSFPLIGQELGGKDHTTAMHAYQKVKTEINNEEAARQEIDLIRQRLYIV